MFENREEAAFQLAEALEKYKEQPDTIVAGIPRGGAVTGKVIADFLHLPLELVLIKKVPHPGNKELAIGATSMESHIIDPDWTAIDPDYIQEKVAEIKASLEHRKERFYGDREPLRMLSRTVIIVDDGVATGNTMLAAIKLVKKSGAKKVVAAIPVSSRQALAEIRKNADETICLDSPSYFYAVGEHYRDFREVMDDEVIRIMGVKGKDKN